MAPTTRKTTRRAPGTRKSVARRARSAAVRVSLADASPSKQKQFFRAVRRLMREKGLKGELVGVSLGEPVTRGRRAVAEAPIGCPPGHVRRLVCVQRPNGTVDCQSECQPF